MVSCTQMHTNNGMGGYGMLPKESPVHRQILALPGQGAVNTHASDTDAAFEEQVKAYTGQSTPATPYPQAVPQVQVPGYPQPATTTLPAEVPGFGIPAATYPQYPIVNQPSADGTAGYAVQVNNATNGRIFIEMHDDSDNLFPVAAMYAGQKISTQPQEPRPIQGQLTVIIRDPDQPGAPELRRYKVTPPPAYMGKTIGITILSGGRYRASLDGEVYYATPEPTEKPAAAPKKESTPAPAAKPATPAPAPAPAA